MTNIEALRAYAALPLKPLDKYADLDEAPARETYYHITDNPDFKLDPEYKPQNNTTMGGSMDPGVFMTQHVGPWAQGYNYWRPWIAEIEAPADLPSGGYSGERFVKADQYSDLEVKRVLPIDAHVRERFNEPGWVESGSGRGFDDDKPFETSWGNSLRNWEGQYEYPGDARDLSPEDQQAYARKVRDYGRAFGVDYGDDYAHEVDAELEDDLDEFDLHYAGHRYAAPGDAPEFPQELIDKMVPAESGGRWIPERGEFRPSQYGDGGSQSFAIRPKDAPATVDAIPGLTRKPTYYDPERIEPTYDEDGRPEFAYKRKEWAEENLPEDYLWRGMSNAEYENAERDGYFQSDGSRNLGGQEGMTMFSTDAEPASNYASGYAPGHQQPTFGSPAHMIGVPNTYPDAWELSHERGVSGQIPFDSMTHHFEGHPSWITPGEASYSKGYNGWEDSGGVGPSMNLDWQPGRGMKLPNVTGAMKATSIPLSSLIAEQGNMQEVLDSGRVSDTPDEPIFVTPRADMPDRYEINDGHHRAADAIRNGRTHMDAFIDDAPDDEPYSEPFFEFGGTQITAAGKQMQDSMLMHEYDTIDVSDPRDYNKVNPGAGPIYRGMYVDFLNNPQLSKIRDWATQNKGNFPLSEIDPEIINLILDKADQGGKGGLGSHWSTDPQIAKNFARDGWRYNMDMLDANMGEDLPEPSGDDLSDFEMAYGESYDPDNSDHVAEMFNDVEQRRPPGVPIVFRGLWDGEDFDDNPSTMDFDGGERGSNLPHEKEVTLPPGKQIELQGINLLEDWDTPDPKFPEAISPYDIPVPRMMVNASRIHVANSGIANGDQMPFYYGPDFDPAIAEHERQTAPTAYDKLPEHMQKKDPGASAIYRGMYVDFLDAEQEEELKDWTRANFEQNWPLSEINPEIINSILDHAEKNGLGPHWSTDPNVAIDFARNGYKFNTDFGKGPSGVKEPMDGDYDQFLDEYGEDYDETNDDHFNQMHDITRYRQPHGVPIVFRGDWDGEDFDFGADTPGFDGKSRNSNVPGESEVTLPRGKQVPLQGINLVSPFGQSGLKPEPGGLSPWDIPVPGTMVTANGSRRTANDGTQGNPFVKPSRGKHNPGGGTQLYRGMYVDFLTPEETDYMVNWTKENRDNFPMSEMRPDIIEKILQHAENPGLGRHWSTDPEVSKSFAREGWQYNNQMTIDAIGDGEHEMFYEVYDKEYDPDDYEDKQLMKEMIDTGEAPYGVPIVFRGLWDGEGFDATGQTPGFDGERRNSDVPTESEVTLSPGSQIDLQGINILNDYDDANPGAYDWEAKSLSPFDIPVPSMKVTASGKIIRTAYADVPSDSYAILPTDAYIALANDRYAELLDEDGLPLIDTPPAGEVPLDEMAAMPKADFYDLPPGAGMPPVDNADPGVVEQELAELSANFDYLGDTSAEDKVLAAEKGVKYKDHLKNLLSHFDASTDREKLAGRVWYKAAAETVQDIAHLTGVSQKKAIAVAAALSARTDWSNNVQYAAHILNTYDPADASAVDNWRLGGVHPDAMRLYLQKRGYEPKKFIDQFTAPELKKAAKNGDLPQSQEDFDELADLHKGMPLMHRQENRPLYDKDGNQRTHPMAAIGDDPETRAQWMQNVNARLDRANPEDIFAGDDVIGSHLRAVKSSTAKRGPQRGGDEYNLPEEKRDKWYQAPTETFRGAGLPTMGSLIDKAKAIMELDDEDEEGFAKILGGDKYQNFNDNLIDAMNFREAREGDPDDVGYYTHPEGGIREHPGSELGGTIDTQHMRASSVPRGEKPPNYAVGSAISAPLYKVFSRGLNDITDYINSRQSDPQKHLLPKQVQAVIWHTFKNYQDANAARPNVGQTYTAPDIEFQDHTERYMSGLQRIASLDWEDLLRHPSTNPYETDPDDWRNMVLTRYMDRNYPDLDAAL